MALILVSGLSGLTLNAQRTVSLKMERHYKLWVECAGEYVEGTLTINHVLSYDKDGNLTRWHRQPMGGTMTGSVSGMVYRTAGATHERLTDQYSLVDNTHIVASGRNGVQYRYHMNMHYKVNADGELTAEVENETILCE